MKHRRLEAITLCPTVYRCDWYIVLVLFSLALLGGTLTVYARAPANSARTLPELLGGIVERSAELVYITEQDSEVFAFYRNTPVKEVTDNVFLAILRRPVETQIIQQSWSSFFQIRVNNDPTGRWGDLKKYLEANLTNLTVFRLPRGAPYGAQYDLYAVGIFNGDTVVGIQMFGVAT